MCKCGFTHHPTSKYITACHPTECLLAFITAPPAGSPMRSHSPDATECRPAAATAASRLSGVLLPPPLLLPLAPPLPLALPLEPAVSAAAAGPRSWNRRNLRLELPAFSTSSLLRPAMLPGCWKCNASAAQRQGQASKAAAAALLPPLSHRPACGEG